MARTAIVQSIRPDRLTPREVGKAFRALVAGGARLMPAGEGKEDPSVFTSARYVPRFSMRLFDTTFFLTDQRFDDDIGFFVGYVAPHEGAKGTIRRIFPRIFYKDSSLVWRVATHLVHTEDENWLGKGDVKWFHSGGEEHLSSAEETTNLPYEIQAAFDDVSRAGAGKHKRDDEAVFLVLRRGPTDRIRPYSDFSGPRARAMEEYKIHGGRDVAGFRRKLDPTSLKFAKGFEPDFKSGVIDVARSASRLYGGAVRKFRILSRNSKIQWQFVASASHVWINPPQALTTRLLTYGTRAVDVNCDEDVFIPGYEYHFLDEDEDPPEMHTQIPEGWAGPPSEIDPHRADASKWIEAMPVTAEFRRTVLRRRRN